MKMVGIRAFEARDIPLEYAEIPGATLFDFKKFNEKLYSIDGKFDLYAFKNEIELAMAENPISVFNTIEMLRERVADRFNAKFFPHTYAIKVGLNIHATPKPIQTNNYYDMHAELLKGFFNLGEKKEEVLENDQEDEFMENLIDDYGFTYKEAKEIISKESFTQEEMLELLQKVFNNTQKKVRDSIIEELEGKYRGKK